MSPRRGAGEGHIKRITLRSGKRAWRGWITVGYRANGTPIRRTVQRATRDEVRDALVALRERYSVGLDLEAESSARLHELLDRWLAHYTETETPKKRTPGNYQWAINHIRAITPGNPLLRGIGEAGLDDIMHRLPAHLATGSLNICRAVLRMAFAQAVRWRLIATNPSVGLKLPRRERDDAPRRTVSSDEAARLLRALADERLGLAVALTYAVAARPGEVAALRVEDVGEGGATLTIRATHNKVGKIVERETPKSARGVRTLPVAPELRPWLLRQLGRVVLERRAMDGQWTAPDEGLLFVRETDGGRLHGAALYQVGRRVAERIGLGNVGPRILRRSMLSALGAAGVDPKVRAAIGGHTEGVTVKHYREVEPDEVGEAMSKIKLEGAE